MLTKIIVLSDIYGLNFNIDKSKLINNQQLISFIFKLIKKTQMILPPKKYMIHQYVINHLKKN